MKRIVVVGVMLLVGAALVSGIGLSVTARGGYGLGMGNSALLDDAFYVMGSTFPSEAAFDSIGDPTAYSTLPFSYGQGFKVLAGPELILLDNLSLELLAGFVLTGDLEIMSYSDASVGTGETDTLTASTFFIPVSLTLKGRVPVGKFTIYGGAGPSFGLFAKTVVAEDSDNGFGTSEHYEYEMKYKLGLGYHGVVGMNYALTQTLFLVFEVRGEQLTFKAKKGKITKYQVNGTDQLMTTFPDVWDREIEFVDDLVDFYTSPANPDAPWQDLAFNVFADSISAFIGIVWRIF